MNRTGILLIVSSLALPAAAATDGVCWNRDIERMDFYSNPPSRGDNNFFSFTVSGTANVTMLYPGTKSMLDLPVSLYELRTNPGITPNFDSSISKGNGYGCSNSFLNGLEYFMPSNVDAPNATTVCPGCVGNYNPNTVYPEPEFRYAGGGGLNDCLEAGNYKGTPGQPGWAWTYRGWQATTSNNGSVSCPANNSPPTNADTPNNTCKAVTGQTSGADYDDCTYCLGRRGYWINYNKSDSDTSPAAMAVQGNWLNFYPPKWAILRLAYKRLVNGPLLNPLREGIVTNNGDVGEYRLQKMLPQSCSGGGRPSQRIASVDGVTYTSVANPLAEMLFNVAWTVSADSNSKAGSAWFLAPGTAPSNEPGVSGETDAKDGFCPGCNSGFSVVFSDGRGVDGLPGCASDGGTVPGYCVDPYDGGVHNSYASCYGSASSGLGLEKDGDNYLPDAGPALAPYAITGPNTCPADQLDDVAAWMFATNLYPPQSGTNLRLYTIGIGDNYFGEQNILRSAASAGKGLYVQANDFASLERNINKVFLDIISNSTSFSVAAITTVQTRGTTFAFIPRFRPLGGAQWEGRLYRFRLFNEFASGCGTAELTGNDGGPIIDSLNPNGNASCNDLYLQDADGGFVGEDDGGTFVLLDPSQPYTDAGWPKKSPTVAATPIWEAADLLLRRETGVVNGAGSGNSRTILTVPLDGGIPAPGSALIAYNDFSANGIAVMSNYMKLGGVNSDFCIGLSSATRHGYATKEDCGADLMKFIDGQDVMRQNTDGGPARPNILGDIFHSSPILVTPPAPNYLCDTGIINQCVRTLYAEDVSGQFTPASKSAYASYYNANKTRQELILVGANDGMLHAFHAGTAYPDGGGFDDGTGQEVWAFIPPDMLPKLQRYALANTHQALVDGAPWVRDIWKDGSGATAADRQKQADEFHTIAIIGEREGGRHYTAIDVTDTSSQPKFLWTWPPPGSPYEMAEGESWNDTTPNPPPIGPVLLQDNSGPINVTVNGSSVKASERWVVVISGGYDPNLVRGRAIYVLDAWTGGLLYKFSRYDTSTSGDPRYQLGPVAAPAAMVDTNYDNFFDVAVVGDTSGNVWSIDMLNPGTASSGLVNNWYGGLTFQQFKGTALSKRSPFFAMAAARVYDDAKGGVRVYLGGGDRDQIKVRDTDAIDGGTCQLDNLRGCLRNNCNVDVLQNNYAIGTGGSAQSLTGEWRYLAGGTSLTTNTFTLSNSSTAGACNDPALVDIRYQVSCAGTTMVDPNDGGTTLLNRLGCDFDGGSDGGEECYDVRGMPEGVGVAFNSPAITNSRFYSIKVFDPPNYLARPRMTTSSTQSTYNVNTLTDTDLTDVSGDAGMPSTAAGWFVKHANDPNEKTASAALLLGGCVAWNTELPSIMNNTPGADGGQICSTGGNIPPDTAFLYQANDDTGVVQCGLPGSNTQLASSRYVARLVTVTPQQPTPVVSLNATTGQAGYSGISLEPGGKIPLQILVGAAAVQGDVSWLNVPRNLHACRHPADGGTPLCSN